MKDEEKEGDDDEEEYLVIARSWCLVNIVPLAILCAYKYLVGVEMLLPVRRSAISEQSPFTIQERVFSKTMRGVCGDDQFANLL
jgi:hypothetical protein